MANEKTTGAKTTRDANNVIDTIDGQVFLSFVAEPAKFTKDGTIPEDWENAGILSEDGKVSVKASKEKTKKKGFGRGVVNVAVKPGEATLEFTSLEENPTIERVRRAHTKKIDGADIVFHDGIITRAFVAYVRKMGNGKTQVFVTREKAYVTIEELGFEGEANGVQVSCDLIAGEDGDLYEIFTYDTADEDTDADVVLERVTGPESA